MENKTKVTSRTALHSSLIENSRSHTPKIKRKINPGQLSILQTNIIDSAKRNNYTYVLDFLNY